MARPHVFFSALLAFGLALGLLTQPAAAQPASATAPPPVEAFGRLPRIADAAISRDGRRVALALSRDGQAIINVIDLEQGRPVYAGALDAESRLRGIGWADNKRVTYVVSQTFHPGAVLPRNMRFVGAPRRVDYYRNGVIDLESQRSTILTTDRDNPWADQGGELIAPIAGDGDYVRLIGRAPGANENYRPAVFRVSLSGGGARPAQVAGDNPNTIFFLIDERGAVAARIDSDRETNRWSLYTYDGATPRLLMEDVSDTGAPIRVQGLTIDGRIAAIDESEGGREALIAIDRASGAKSVLFAREDADISSAILDPWTRRVVGAGWWGQDPGFHFFDPTLEAVSAKIVDFFGGGSAYLAGWAEDRSRILVYGEVGLDGGGYYVYTPASDRFSFIAARYPELSDVDLGVRQEISYPARDGVRIPAYLTLPQGALEARGLPLVVLVHGGPHSRDTMEFDWWATFLASRGYAVLQPNFRGSSGYGTAWQEAGYGQWGGLMQTDVEDGVAALTRTGRADAARVCIVGASYGGYAALAGATLTPDRYRCAASIAGLSDLEARLRDIELRTGDDSMGADFMRKSIGDRQEDRQRIRDVSPARLAERVKIPILLIHGTDDTVVPITHSRLMRDRLQGAGKQVRMVELRGDDHWLSDEETRVQMLRELEAFLGQNLGAR